MLDIFERLDAEEFPDVKVNKNEYVDGVALTEEESYGEYLSIDMIMATIEEQFANPFQYAKQDFMKQYFALRSYRRKMAVEDDDLEEITEEDLEFKGFMIRIFMDYLKIGFPNITDMNEDEQDALLHMTYRLFFFHIKRNFKSLIYNTLIKNEEYFLNLFEYDTDYNSVIEKSQPFLTSTGLLFMHHIFEIGQYIINPDTYETVDDFLDLIASSSLKNQAEITTVSEAYETCDITGNFIFDYLSMLDQDNDGEISELIAFYIRKCYYSKTQGVNAMAN